MQEWLRLRPTAAQYRAFGEHLCKAHSWYKHLPLLSGRTFVVFIAPDAGMQRSALVPYDGPDADFSIVTLAESCEYTDEDPRLHYSWKTTREYRRRFGHLDYLYRRTDIGSHKDTAGPQRNLPAPLPEECTFVLYPYVHEYFHSFFLGGVYAKALKQLRAGVAHPTRVELLELAQVCDAPRTSSGNFSALLRSLREREVSKIRRALAALDDWLVQSQAP